jgi:hypothetical protein
MELDERRRKEGKISNSNRDRIPSRILSSGIRALAIPSNHPRVCLNGQEISAWS